MTAKRTANVDRHVKALAADPGDERAFARLEEAYFEAAEWEKLAALYDQRLEDPRLTDAAQRAALHFRLGQILEERCLEIDRAIAHYTEAATLDPSSRQALRQLRLVHAGRDAWDVVLQIAEVESGVLHEPYERAEFFAEMGHVWLEHIGDANEAMSCFQQALAIEPAQKEALRGLARTLEAQGQPEAAAATWERLVGCLRGPDRAAPLVALASLLAGPLRQDQRAVELYRRALGDDPRNEKAVEALSVSAAARGQWELLSDLYDRRFSLAAGAKRRTAIALEAGYMQLEQMRNTEAARVWFERARDLSSEEIPVLSAFVDLERHCQDEDALLDALQRVAEQGRASAPQRVLLELASLLAKRGEHERVVRYLELAQRRSPDDPRVLEGLTGAYASLHRHEELVGVLERRASLAENDPKVRAATLLELGRIHADHLHDDEAAREALERAFTEQPATPGLASTLETLYRKNDHFRPLRALLERACEAGPESERPAFHCSLGELLEQHFDDPDASAVYFEASFELSPNARALQGLSRLARRSGRPEAMVRALEREIEFTGDPARLGELCDELRERFEEQGDLETALVWVARGLDACPESRRHLEALASLQQRMGRHDELAGTLGRLEQVVTGGERAGVRRRLAELHEERGDADAALTCWESALELQPEDIASLSALRRHYAERGRHEDLAPLLRRLADVLPEEASVPVLDELGTLLDEQLCDLDGAIVVLWRLASLPGARGDVGRRLESLLERAGRFAELAQQLLERRRRLPDESEEAIEIDLRRGQLLLDPLGQLEEAVSAFEAVRARAPDREDATLGLERALRAANDSAGLCRLLAEMAERSRDGNRREELLFERAVLLEDSLGELEQARQAYAALCDSGSATSARAALRLESLLERCGDFEALRARLEAAIPSSDRDRQRDLHERIASICADRTGDRQGQVLHLEAASRLDPGRPEPWRRLAALYQELERPDDLLRVTEAELATGPDGERERVLRARAAALLAARPGDPAAARVHYERLLELAPGHADATEFLVARYEDEGRFAEVASLLEDRLAAVSARDADARDDFQGLEISLRLRIAELRAGALGDPQAAIEMLEPALRASGAAGPAAEPLAELYERTRRHGDLVDLCQQAAGASASPSERALWLRRLARGLREQGDDAGAATAYREVLDLRPEDEEAYGSLCDLYRKIDEPGPLADLLAAGLARASGAREIDLRMELAGILDEKLDRPSQALEHVRRVMELERHHDAAQKRALRLTERLGMHADRLALIDGRLEQRTPPEERAELLESRARLLAGPLGAPEAAVATLREVIALDPDRRSARSALRETLERLGRWTAVLDCLYVDSRSADREERAAIYERAVEVATARVGPDAALPWLERLRAARPNDPLVIARIADVHRLAGRFESVLRALEDELALTTDVERKRELHVGRARILERDMNAPGRAIAALEAARGLAPRDAATLERLDELYALTRRDKERVEVLEARIALLEAGASADETDSLRLHLTAAGLCTDSLSDAAGAVPHLLRAVFLTRALSGGGSPDGPISTPEARVALLADLASALRAAGREEACARALEGELSVLLVDLAERPPASGQDPRHERRVALHRELAWLYADELASPAAALRHMRVVLDLRAESACPGLTREELDRLEGAFLDRLRRDGNWIELAERLAGRLERGPGSGDEWLELAQLLDERLHAPEGALDAYARSLALEPASLPAIRGLRDSAERLDRWPEVVRALDLELGLPGRWSPRERSILARRIGEICWHRLDDPDRATRAYAEALRADPRDLESLRALEDLRRLREQWVEALDLFEREAEVLGRDDDARLAQVWLAVAKIARERTREPARAILGYERAAELSRLEPGDLRDLAELYRETGAREKYAARYAEWCDDPRSGARCDEHLALAETLIGLGRRSEALERARLAGRIDARSANAWAAIARLLENRGDDAEAADAWERASELRHGPEASEHLTSAALLVERADPEAAARRLRRAVELDAGSAIARAHLARVALTSESLAEAEESSARALDLAAAGSGEALGDALRLETALVGGRAARRGARLEAAVLFFGVALEIDPDHEEALEAYGELLFERGDLLAAREALEARLALGPDERRAERLSMLASSLEIAGETREALDRFREAVACDPAWGAGHAGVARLCEKAGRIDDAVDALTGWAAAAAGDGDTAGCAARLVRAAELELERSRVGAAESHLRRAVEAAPHTPRAWVLLAETLADAQRVDDVLDVVPRALQSDPVRRAGDAVARLSLLQARALEAREKPAEACDAYGEAVRHDPRCAEAALARARLLRARGDWREAADALRSFCEAHPEPDHRDLAEPHYKLARLLAGPLEDIDGALLQFERVIEIAPDHGRAREPLASLLSVLPERWREAIAHHAALLQEEPTRAASIRSLIQIARNRGNEEARRLGLALLRGIGAASPGERTEAPHSLPRAIVVTPILEDPAQELARRVLLQAGEALEQVLDTALEDAALRGTSTGFDARLRAAERDLCAAGLDRFSDGELSDLVCAIAALSLGEDVAPPLARHLDPAFLRALAQALGRWTRRKIRRGLDGGSLDALRDLDYSAWRNAFRGLAAASAVDASQGDLRTALRALCARESSAAPAAPEGDDWTTRIEATPAARELLRRVAAGWCEELLRS